MSAELELITVRIKKPEELNLILGQAHFIKTVEDLYEALAGSSPHLLFGLAFCESSGPGSSGGRATTRSSSSSPSATPWRSGRATPSSSSCVRATR
jgi:hypothetical protein